MCIWPTASHLVTNKASKNYDCCGSLGSNKPARDRAITARNIRAGWAAAGLFPFNPDRVLRDMPKPPAEHTSSGADIAATSSRNEVPPTPVTPVTPVTVEALTSLHDLIKQDACAAASDDATRQRLQKHVQKLASAAKISFAKQSLLQDHNRLLYGSIAKPRRDGLHGRWL
jgi:hypothetical protein